MLFVLFFILLGWMKCFCEIYDKRVVMKREVSVVIKLMLIEMVELVLIGDVNGFVIVGVLFVEGLFVGGVGGEVVGDIIGVVEGVGVGVIKDGFGDVVGGVIGEGIIGVRIGVDGVMVGIDVGVVIGVMIGVIIGVIMGVISGVGIGVMVGGVVGVSCVVVRLRGVIIVLIWKKL